MVFFRLDVGDSRDMRATLACDPGSAGHSALARRSVLFLNKLSLRQVSAAFTGAERSVCIRLIVRHLHQSGVTWASVKKYLKLLNLICSFFV